MATVSLAEAKAHLSALVERAAAGEPVRIPSAGQAGGPDHRNRDPAKANRCSCAS
jgi:hypothetical protein